MGAPPGPRLDPPLKTVCFPWLRTSNRRDFALPWPIFANSHSLQTATLKLSIVGQDNARAFDETVEIRCLMHGDVIADHARSADTMHDFELPYLKNRINWRQGPFRIGRLTVWGRVPGGGGGGEREWALSGHRAYWEGIWWKKITHNLTSFFVALWHNVKFAFPLVQGRTGVSQNDVCRAGREGGREGGEGQTWAAW